jgi:hypothetical protein
MRVDSQEDQDIVQGAADRVTEHEIILRAAFRSMTIRLKPGHVIETTFELTALALTSAYLELGPAITACALGRWDDKAETSVQAARETLNTFHDLFAEALNSARAVVGFAH